QSFPMLCRFGDRRYGRFGKLRCEFVQRLAGMAFALFVLVGGVESGAQSTGAYLARGPYLQCGTTSNMVVRWRTQPASDSRVRFGLSVDDLAWEMSDATISSEHSLTLTNLSPNTKYFYAIGSTKESLTGGPEFFFVTAPLAGKPTRIWALGDCGTVSQPGYAGQPLV